MNKKLLWFVVIIVVIFIGLFIGKNIFYKTSSNVSIPISVPTGTLDLKSVSTTPPITIRKDLDLGTFTEGESTYRSFGSQSNDLLVFFKMLTDINHQARNPTYDILLNQNKIGEVTGQGLAVTGFSQDNKYFAFRTRSVTGCSGTCQDFNAFIVDTAKREVIQIPFPSSKENYVKNPADFTDIIQFISIGNWQNNTTLNISSYLVGIDKKEGELYRISPKETWAYDLNTKQYMLIETLPE